MDFEPRAEITGGRVTYLFRYLCHAEFAVFKKLFCLFHTLFLDVFAYTRRERFFRLYVERGTAHSQGRSYLVYGEVAFAVVRFYILFEFIYETLVTFF